MLSVIDNRQSEDKARYKNSDDQGTHSSGYKTVNAIVMKYTIEKYNF